MPTDNRANHPTRFQRFAQQNPPRHQRRILTAEEARAERERRAVEEIIAYQSTITPERMAYISERTAELAKERGWK